MWGRGGLADTLIETEFSIALKEREFISPIFVIARDPSERQLDMDDYIYGQLKGVLTIRRSVLSTSDDKLRIDISKDGPPA